MYLTLLILASAAITLFMASKLANFFLAKRPEVKWLVLAFLASALIALLSYIGLTFIIAWLDLGATDSSQMLTTRYPTLILTISSVIMLLLSSVAFKVINQMCWSSAIATNITTAAMMLVTLAGTMALDEGSSDKVEITKVALPEIVLPEAVPTKKDQSIAKVLSPN